jgi:hypothetical protein
MNNFSVEGSSEVLERMSFSYPPEISPSERETIDVSRSYVADAMMGSYWALMTDLPNEASWQIVDYQKGLRQLYIKGLRFPERQYSTLFKNNLNKHGHPVSNFDLQMLFDFSTDDECYHASMGTLVRLHLAQPNEFSKLFLVKGDYPRGGPNEWLYHVYFIAEKNLVPSDLDHDGKSWYFAGSPANGRFYRDPLHLYESGSLMELMHSINIDEGNIFPSGSEIMERFYRYPYEHLVTETVPRTVDFVQPKLYVVEKMASGIVTSTCEFETAGYYTGSKLGRDPSPYTPLRSNGIM